MDQQTLEQIDASLKRWNTRLRRAVTAIGKLQRRRTRLAAKGANVAAPPTGPVKVLKGDGPWPALEREQAKTRAKAATEPAPADSLDIPGFLRRTPATPNATDQAAADAIAAEQADHKRRKAAGQAAKRKAKAAGELRQMPLSGKAALAKIAAG